jgi:hypothetical protein
MSIPITKELQLMILQSFDNYFAGRCLFCGQEYDSIIEMHIEAISKTTEFRLCNECIQTYEEGEEKHPDQDSITETLLEEDSVCPKCGSREIGFSFEKIKWNCNEEGCKFEWEGFVKDL